MAGSVEKVDSYQIDDMVFPKTQIFSGFTGKRWPGGKLIFDVSALPPTGQQAFADACGLWAAVSPIKCVKRTNETGGYLKIEPVAGNVSTTDVGFRGPTTNSNMKLCCFSNPIHIAHEIGHALGLSHEQMRSDRDQFVKISTENIKPGHERQFDKRTTDNYGSYDFHSIMHYRQDAFSANGKPTIVVLPPNERFQSTIGHASAISAADAKGMKDRYAGP